MSGMVVVAQALAIVLKGNEKPTNRKKEQFYHRLLKTGVFFYKRGFKNVHGSHSVLHGKRFSDALGWHCASEFNWYVVLGTSSIAYDIDYMTDVSYNRHPDRSTRIRFLILPMSCKR